MASELIILPLRSPQPQLGASSVLTPRTAKGILVAGFIATFASAYFGARTYASQVGASDTSHLAALLTPFTSWVIAGIAFLLYCYARGDSSRRNTIVWLGASAFLYMVYATFLLGRAAPLAAFMVATLVGCVITGLTRRGRSQ